MIQPSGTFKGNRSFIKHRLPVILVGAVLVVTVSISAVSQQPTAPPAPSPQAGSSAPSAPEPDPFYVPTPHPNETKFLQHLAEDQKDIFTSPFHVSPGAFKWLVPSAGIAAGLFASDPDSSFAMKNSHDHALNLFSDAGVAAAAGLTGASYFWGHITHNERMRETGVLATEAMLDVLPLQFGIRYSIGRLRPYQSNYQNVFFDGGNSFPSNHAAVMFAFASVVAREYPNPFAEFGAYGLATAVSMARAASGQHFLSDLFIGGLIGYQVGRHIFNERHNPKIDDDLKIVAEQTSAIRPGNLASPYVPLDSWAYPAFEQLIGRGYIDTATLGLRPWTRMSCARLLVEMQEKVEQHGDLPPQVVQLQKFLEAEFAEELEALEGRAVESIQLDTLYTRTLDIAGKPLNDSYHFGQTLINDEGRPYQQGVNNITGFSARAQDGRFAFYVSGEYQHSPSAPPYSLLERSVIAEVDLNPLQPPTPFATVDSFRLLDTYVAMKYAGLDVSVGKQSLWWGPGEGGALLMSNNAVPLWMIQIKRSAPLYIPGVSKVLGPIETDNFFGSLAQHHFPPGPYMFGQKFSCKPLRDLSLSISRTVIFAGQGHVPLTFGSFWNSFTSFTNVPVSVKFSRNDPGARHAEFDLSWRLPKLQRWLTFYTDSIVHDDVNALPNARAGINPGIYLSHVPKLPKLDFRVEAVYTNPPGATEQGGRFLYYEIVYHDLYLNDGYLMGSWIGREGTGYQAWSTYSINPQSNIQANFRYAKIAKDFIPRGSTQWDATVSTMLRIRKDIQLKALAQYESWLEPVVAPNRQRDFTTSVEFTWWPGLAAKRPLVPR
jgi:membrane-associated phospholipid phosphatase